MRRDVAAELSQTPPVLLYDGLYLEAAQVRSMKKIQIALWSLVVVFGGMAAYLAFNTVSPDNGFKLGGPFQLETTSGEPFTDKDMLGRPHLVLFGFTHCPEVCPTTLFEISGWMDTLGEDAKNLDAYFISVDPERDTRELLAGYLDPFKDRVTGLTGSPEEVDKAAKGYHVYYKKVALDDGSYTMDHTASIFLMRADGSFMGTIAWQENSDIALDKIRRLMKG